jgi:hypothetical protein
MAPAKIWREAVEVDCISSINESPKFQVDAAAKRLIVTELHGVELYGVNPFIYQETKELAGQLTNGTAWHLDSMKTGSSMVYHPPSCRWFWIVTGYLCTDDKSFFTGHSPFDRADKCYLPSAKSHLEALSDYRAKYPDGWLPTMLTEEPVKCPLDGCVFSKKTPLQYENKTVWKAVGERTPPPKKPAKPNKRVKTTATPSM